MNDHMIRDKYLYQSFTSIYSIDVIAKYCFESELVTIPDTDMYLEAEDGVWVVYTSDEESLFLVSHEDFLVNYAPQDKKASNYLDFVVDSVNANYTPIANMLDESLLETAGEFIEKEISLSFRERLKLIWDIILGKKINISKY